MGRTQPVRDSEFIAWASNINLQCTEHQYEWQLSAVTVQKLNTLTENARVAYQANINPELSNRRTTANKKTAFLELRRFLSLFVKVLLANEAVDESNLAAMVLPSRIHHFHDRLPAPTDAPKMTIVAGRHRDVTVYVSVPRFGHPTEHLSRKGYYGFVLRYRKEGETEWHEKHSTRLHTTLMFDSEDAGKRLTLSVAWINPRIQHGPWSHEETVLIG
ncbi:MAG: hypothetical protein LBP64_00210 [Tannerella sp.]|nr:hypothetical protein [Tannerella sp.]